MLVVEVIIVVAVCYHVGKWLVNWKESWEPCPHGVPGGNARNCCQRCVREKEEIEENRRRERELQERQRRIEQELQQRQQRIDAAADRLRNDERLRLAKSVVWSIREMRGFTPQRFEDEVAGMFSRLGYEVKQTPYTKDGGRDGILKKDGKKFLYECKKYGKGSFSGRPDLQRFHSAIITDDAAFGFFVTTGRFTKDAIEFAATVPIKLIDQSELVRMMFDSKPDAEEDVSYRSMCRQCEDIVSHHLRAALSIKCRNGHEIAPTLDKDSILPVSTQTTGARRTPEQTGGIGSHWKKEQQMAREAIIGNTYPVKDQLKALGGRWNPDQNAWMVPTDKADQAKALVANAGKRLKQPLSETEQQLFDKQGLSSGADTATTTMTNGVSRQDIQTGDRIVIRYLDDNKTATYTLSDARNDPTNGVLSVTSPLGEQLLGLAEGDETEFEVGGRLRPVLIDHVFASTSELGGETSVEALMASAKTHTEKGNYDRAITDFDEAIRLDPKVAVSFYRRGLAYDHQGQHNRAIADFDEAIRLDPNFTQAIKSRAEAIALMASRVTNKLAASGVINEIQRWLDQKAREESRKQQSEAQ